MGGNKRDAALAQQLAIRDNSRLQDTCDACEAECADQLLCTRVDQQWNFVLGGWNQ